MTMDIYMLVKLIDFHILLPSGFGSAIVIETYSFEKHLKYKRFENISNDIELGIARESEKEQTSSLRSVGGLVGTYFFFIRR